MVTCKHNETVWPQTEVFFLYSSRLPWWINHSFLCGFDLLYLGSVCSTPGVSNTTLSSSSFGGQVRPFSTWYIIYVQYVSAFLWRHIKVKWTICMQTCFFLGCSAGSLFENEWSLKPEYKRGGNRLELADRLASRILWIGIANLLLCPVILVWQILYAFFSYTEVSGSHAHANIVQTLYNCTIL